MRAVRYRWHVVDVAYGPGCGRLDCEDMIALAASGSAFLGLINQVGVEIAVSEGFACSGKRSPLSRCPEAAYRFRCS